MEDRHQHHSSSSKPTSSSSKGHKSSNHKSNDKHSTKSWTMESFQNYQKLAIENKNRQQMLQQRGGFKRRKKPVMSVTSNGEVNRIPLSAAPTPKASSLASPAEAIPAAPIEPVRKQKANQMDMEHLKIRDQERRLWAVHATQFDMNAQSELMEVFEKKYNCSRSWSPL